MADLGTRGTFLNMEMNVWNSVKADWKEQGQHTPLTLTDKRDNKKNGSAIRGWGMKNAAEGRQTFDALNGMRGVAALAVAFMHIQWFLNGIHPVIVSVAVDFFFVLSGFVIAHAYEEDLRQGYRRRHFMLARFIRLYPLFLVGLVLGAMSKWLYEYPEDPMTFWGNVGFNLFMLPYPFPYPGEYDNSFPLNFPAWSLFYELVAYSLFAVLIRRLTGQWLAVVIAVGLAGLLFTGFTEGTLDRGTWRPSVIGGLSRVVFSFFVGVALHRLWQRRGAPIALHPAGMLLLLTLPLLWRPEEGLNAWFYELAIITFYMPAMVWLGTGSVATGHCQKLCAVLGAISYPLYITHAPVYLFVGRYDNWQGSVFMDKNQPWAALILIAALCLGSWMFATYIDMPLRRWLSRSLLPQKASYPIELEAATDEDVLTSP
jgi:peptidoglycan/LPS O-acetylase OafA/YrhL